MIEQLLFNYPLMKTMLKKLKTDIRSFSIMRGLESEESVIYALSLGEYDFDGLPYPPAGNVTDKTATVAAQYKKKFTKIRK